MSVHKTVTDIKDLQAYVARLEEELENMRQVLSALLEEMPLDPEVKERLDSLLVVETEVELKPVKIHYKKTIQELLDESQNQSRK